MTRMPRARLFALPAAAAMVLIALVPGQSALAAGGAAGSPGADAAYVPVNGAAPAVGADGLSKPVYDYATAVHESVRVATRMDTDGDGERDTVAVDIIRPREAEQAGVRVPVIMDASPYFACCGRGNESQLKTYDSNGVIAAMPLHYDNYFVPRGYASVGVDVLGTGRSTGCGDMGGPDEIASVTAVIDWLNGRNTATDLAGMPVTAAWSTGAVGMIGKSYDGTLANGAAATGVEGLKTIVPISAIDSWYFYTRTGGVVYYDNYSSFLTGYVGRDDGVCDAQREALDVAADDASGSYNSYWRARDYLRKADQVQASVFAVHGVNDNNVKMDNLSTWWDALGDAGVTRRLWLSQEGHVDPFDFRRGPWVKELHRWFDHELLGLDNGVLDTPAVTVERSPNSYVTQANWPASRPATTVQLGRAGLGSNTGGTLAIKDNPDLGENAAVSNVPDQTVDGRILLGSAPLTAPIRVSGTPTVTLRISADRADTPVTARLVDYGPSRRPVGEGVTTLATSSCWGQSSAVDSACYFDVAHRFRTQDVSVLSRGWISAAHSRSLANPTPLVPGQWRTVTVPLKAQDVTIPAGHQIGLVITLGDNSFTTPHVGGATVAVNLAASTLNLPLTSAATILPGQITTDAPAPSPAPKSATTPPVPLG